MLDPVSQDLAVQGSTFLYPALPQKFLQNETAIAQGYRKQLGYNRVLGIGVGILLAAWLTDFVRGQ